MRIIVLSISLIVGIIAAVVNCVSDNVLIDYTSLLICCMFTSLATVLLYEQFRRK